MGLRCCSRRRSIMLLADDYCLIYTVCGEKQRVTKKNTLSDSIHGGSLMDRMQGESDSQLLREYAENGSEAAFRKSSPVTPIWYFRRRCGKSGRPIWPATRLKTCLLTSPVK